MCVRDTFYLIFCQIQSYLPGSARYTNPGKISNNVPEKFETFPGNFVEAFVCRRIIPNEFFFYSKLKIDTSEDLCKIIFNKSERKFSLQELWVFEE